MAGETELIPAADDVDLPTTDGDLKFIEQVVHSLPADVVRELFSLGVCVCCIFRFFGIYNHISSRPALQASALTDFVRKVIGLAKDDNCDASTKSEVMCGEKTSNKLDMVNEVCKICVGILNFVYHDEKGILIKKDSANEFAAVIAEAVKREHGQIDSFSLEVSLPSLLTENEQAVWLYIRKKYASQLESAGHSISGNLSTKDALKLSIVDPLEKLLGVKFKTSSFHIRFTYSSFEESARHEVINGCKRRKTGKFDANSRRYASESFGTENSNYQACENQENMKTSTDQAEGHGIHLLKDQLEKVNQPNRLIFLCYRSPVYIGGRYLKYSRNVSQTRWVIDDERMGEASVEEIVGGSILPLCQGDSYKFHAAGREDIDVRMLGTGRPFLVEIQNARQVPSVELINQIETKINSLENKLVGVKNLQVLGSKGWELMREGETEKQKQYAALVWLSRPLNDDDLQTLSSLKEMQILQNTPVRVLHRRSPLEREKIIHWMKVERIAGSSQYFLLHLCTQAGTYIKEFVHGDLGRTKPSIGSILGCRAEILQLDVTDVKMDCF